MVRDSLQWNLSDEKCCEIVHLTIIDLLNGNKNKTLPLNELVILMNSRTRLYKINNNKKYNTFSKYLKLKHGGILNFVEKTLSLILCIYFSVEDIQEYLCQILLESDLLALLIFKAYRLY